MLKQNISYDISMKDIVLNLIGQREVVLENYGGIKAYEPDVLVVGGMESSVVIQGKELEIAYYTKNEMKVAGKIHQIVLESLRT